MGSRPYPPAGRDPEVRMQGERAYPVSAFRLMHIGRSDDVGVRPAAT